MKTLKNSCRLRPSVFDVAKRDTVLTIEDLLKQRIDPIHFFEENYLTDGMKELLKHAFRRLEGSSEQGVFRLCQSMGGGKTHNLIALGLLARYPEFRKKVMESFYIPKLLGEVKVIVFNGRECDAKFGIWGELADQLGKRELLKDYYSPLQAPGQKTWTTLLQGQPLIIMLDELPPYLDGARATTVGSSDLSQVTAQALGNLFVAVQESLPNVCLVLTDLAHAYEEGSNLLSSALDKISKEADRTSYNLYPVKLNSDEFYHILRKRIFSELPDEGTIDSVAQGFSAALRDYKEMALTTATPEQLASDIRKSYPFHPSLRDLFARFRENNGFQQTRGLIRLLRSMAARLWNDDLKDPYLLAPYHIDLNDEEIRKQIVDIHSSLQNAISHDIASQGTAVAERLGPDAVDAANLLLMSSLSTTAHAVRGLSEPEIIHYLAAPGRRLVDFRASVLEPMRTNCWYLHATNDHKLFFKDEQNFSAMLHDRSKNYGQEHFNKEIESELREFFKPKDRECYQELLLFKSLDEVRLTKDKISLLISKEWSSELEDFWKEQEYFNRLCLLCGDSRSCNALYDAARRYKALQSILDEFRSQGYSENEPCMKEARANEDRIRQDFRSALRETYTKLYYPVKDKNIHHVDFKMEFLANAFDGEQQVIRALESRKKYLSEESFDTSVKKVEQRLFTRSTAPWSEIIEKAAINGYWQWHPMRLFDEIKSHALRIGRWRERHGQLQKAPFDDPTEVDVRLECRDENGVATLIVKPSMGDTIYYREGEGDVTPQDCLLAGEELKTDALQVSFLAIDSKGFIRTGAPRFWKNTITIKASLLDGKISLQSTPHNSATEIYYTLEGSSPKNSGQLYQGPIDLEGKSLTLSAYAKCGGIESSILTKDFHAESLYKGKTVIPLPRVEGPCLLKAPVRTQTREESYRLLKLLVNYQPSVKGFTVEVSTGGRCYLSFKGGGDYQMSSSSFQEEVNRFHKLLDQGNLSLTIHELCFEEGAVLENFCCEWGVSPTPEQVSQL